MSFENTRHLPPVTCWVVHHRHPAGCAGRGCRCRTVPLWSGLPPVMSQQGRGKQSVIKLFALFTETTPGAQQRSRHLTKLSPTPSANGAFHFPRKSEGHHIWADNVPFVSKKTRCCEHCKPIPAHYVIVSKHKNKISAGMCCTILLGQLFNDTKTDHVSDKWCFHSMSLRHTGRLYWFVEVLPTFWPEIPS